MKLFIFFILACQLATLGYVESRDDLFQSERGYWIRNTTAAGLYNSATEKCCLGSVYLNKKPTYDKCCGSNVFDSSKELCCNDAVVPMVPGESCCGQKTITTDSSLCCDGEEVKLETEVAPFAKCCGKKSYDTRKETCCKAEADFHVLEGENKACCGDKTYERSKESCCQNVKNGIITYDVVPHDGKRTSCCVASVYDPSTETCCFGKVSPGRLSCCAEGITFDSSTQLCRKGEIIEKEGKNLDFCDDDIYDADNEICCVDYNTSNGTAIKVVTKTGKNQRNCCGLQPYDRDAQMCCQPSKILVESGKDHYACCEGKSYHYRDGLCCNDVLIPNFSIMTHDCCGSKPVDKSTNICCGDSEVYDSDTHLCCNSYNASTYSQTFLLLQKSTDTSHCCGLEVYDSDKQLCCKEQIYPKLGNSFCCGKEAFDKDKEVCCSDSTVFPKENGRETCCLYGTTDNFPYPGLYP